jgi:hypothetical protein
MKSGYAPLSESVREYHITHEIATGSHSAFIGRTLTLPSHSLIPCVKSLCSYQRGISIVSNIKRALLRPLLRPILNTSTPLCTPIHTNSQHVHPHALQRPHSDCPRGSIHPKTATQPCDRREQQLATCIWHRNHMRHPVR